MDNQKPQTFNQLIVTRPVEQGQSILAKLQNAVGNIIDVKHLPLIEIAAKPFDIPHDFAVKYLVFVSSNAVKHFAEHAQSAALVEECQIFAVGENTALACERILNKKAVYPNQMNAEGLLALPELTNISQQKWLVIKGAGGRKLLSETLRTRGAITQELDVYQREMPAESKLATIAGAAGINTLWTISSAQALLNLKQVLNPSEQISVAEMSTPIKVVVTSDRLAKLAQENGFSIAAQSNGAAEEQLLQCIKSFFTTQD